MGHPSKEETAEILEDDRHIKAGGDERGQAEREYDLRGPACRE
jgi:hypothetical protein